MNADGIIQDLGDKIKQLVISESIAKGQVTEYQQEIARLNSVINEKNKIINNLQNHTCQCGDDCKCHHDEIKIEEE